MSLRTLRSSATRLAPLLVVVSRRRLATVVVQHQAPQTVIEKIVQRHAVGLPVGKVVKAGDYVMIRPEHVMTHDNTGPVISKFKSIGATQIKLPRQPVFTLDHDVQNKSSKNLAKYANIETFARTRGVDFYPAGRGIGHQILVEEGYAFPYTLTVASDSHSNMYGGVGCVGTPIVRTDAAAIWATGTTWWQVPRMVKVDLRGKLAAGVTGKDVIVALCGAFNKDEVLNAAIEFSGDGIAALPIDDRLTIANMTTEWGALVGFFPVDDVLLQWYEAVLKKLQLRTFSMDSSIIPAPPEHPRINRHRLDAVRFAPLSSDPGAEYAAHLVLDLATLVPHVSGPNSVKISTPLPDLESRRIKIQKAYLVSCTNSRASDLAAAAAVRESERVGDWETLVAAGARVLPAGNYKGRMGHPAAQAYLASPAIVAASALKGYIASPDLLDVAALPSSAPPVYSITSSSSPKVTAAEAQAEEPLLPSFPYTFRGPLLFAPQDNLNTDGIYPGKYTYQDDITLARQAEVVMENYDTGFASHVRTLIASPPPSAGVAGVVGTAAPEDGNGVKTGVILVAGYNFGTGSSREQAATALKAAGVPLILAGSFGDIFKRNAINNGLVCLEAPELIADLTRVYAKNGTRGAGGLAGEPTVDAGLAVSVCMRDGKVEVTGMDGGSRIYAVRPVGQSVQELWICGGLEGYILKSIQAEAPST
ncbi:homoaconitase [Multifurca ochricompacta]|uniref:Homoaconitase n=1 Tax=Multifurca ochricompacta TaxID=376703 RepID=A0AAD4M0T9_9AGAM|nr:homoaconitase [Multifurca ochricompacta]